MQPSFPALCDRDHLCSSSELRTEAGARLVLKKRLHLLGFDASFLQPWAKPSRGRQGLWRVKKSSF